MLFIIELFLNIYSGPRHRNYHKTGLNRTPEHNHHNHCRCDSSSIITSDIETTSFVDSDDDDDDDEITSRISTTTDETSVSRIHDRRHRRRRRRHRMPVMSRVRLLFHSHRDFSLNDLKI